jgi:hypothetical protein
MLFLIWFPPSMALTDLEYIRNLSLNDARNGKHELLASCLFVVTLAPSNTHGHVLSSLPVSAHSGVSNNQSITMDPKDSDRNYFVCTLGEAAEENKKHPHDFKTINELLDVQAQFEHQFPVIGFPMLDKDGSLNAQLFSKSSVFTKYT